MCKCIPYDANSFVEWFHVDPEYIEMIDTLFWNLIEMAIIPISYHHYSVIRQCSEIFTQFV